MLDNQFYDDHADEFYRNTIAINMKELYEPFLALIPKGGTILDAGCGSGRDSLYFMQHGYKVTAFDASAALVELSTRLIHQEVLHLPFQKLDFHLEFDGVWACASLLHVPRGEIDQVLERIVEALRFNGVLYVSFKYGRSDYESKDRFFSCYDEASFENLLVRHPSLRMIQNWTTADARRHSPNDRWLNALVSKSQLPYDAVPGSNNI